MYHMTDKVAVTVVDMKQKEYTVWGLSGQTVMEVLQLNTIESDNYCGGNGTCGKCKIKVEGLVNEITPTEKQLLLPEEIRQNIRLGCRTIINGAAKVFLEGYETYIPQLISNQVEQDITEEKIHLHSFFIPGLDKEFPIALHRRITEALNEFKLDISPDNINELLSIDRAGRPSLQLYAVVFPGQIVKYISREPKKIYGIAIDLGSTSLFAALVDLLEGQVAAVSSKTNMQRIYGADIISRLSYAMQNEEGEKNLHQILINNINSMIEELVKQAAITPNQIFTLNVVGNPVMLHFFTNISVKGFTSSPYGGAFIDELYLRAKELGVTINEEACISLLPQIGGFVGADTVAALLNLEEKTISYLLVDIGTNGEIVLHKDGQMWATSAAAGPALEGGHITCGVRAGSGSIDKVWLGENDGLEFNLIGEKPVKGLCGSAIIDLTAVLLKGKYIDNNGIINQESKQGIKVIDGDSNRHLIIYDQEDILPGQPIIFSQEDIRQVQLAKSALRTAIDLLLEKAKISYDDIDKIFLAGAFGNFLNPVNAISIGLLPPIEPHKVVNIGNAAANGAILSLLSKSKRTYAAKLARNIKYIELANNQNFQEQFINNLNFPVNDY